MAEAFLLTNILDRRGSQYSHFVFEVCLEKKESGYEIVFGKIFAAKRGESKPPRSPIDFGDYVYAACYFELSELGLILQESNPTFTVNGYKAILQNAYLRPSSMSRLSSNNDLSEWPADLMELRPNSHSNYVPLKTLVAHNTSRLFHDVYDGIEQFMGTRISNNYNNGWIGAVLFILPDYRVRICDIGGAEQELTVKLLKDAGLINARIHCLVEGSGGREEISKPIGGTAVFLQLKSQVDQIESLKVFVTVVNEGMIDSYEQTPLHHTGRTRWLTSSQRNESGELIDEIRKGEGLNLEFKPFVRIGKGEGQAEDENKLSDLVRAAIAFANSTGGKILLGVNNTGEIDGIDGGLRRVARGADLIATADQYGRELRTKINDSTSTRLDMQPRVLEMANRIVLELNVKELPFADKPAWQLATKDTWVRRGATNFKADPEMIRTDFVQEKEGWMS